MSGRKQRRAPPKTERDYVPGTLLDWNDSSHWNYDGPGPCRYCDIPTQLVDRGRHYAHKVCAEEALALQAAEAQAAYHQEGTT